MNINEFVPKNINVEKLVENVVEGSGKYSEIVKLVYENKIIPLTNNNGDIIGIDIHLTDDYLEDKIQQVIFEKKFRGVNVYKYFERSYKLKLSGVKLEDVDLEEFEEKVEENKEDLPSEVEIPLDYLEEDNLKGIKKYLKETYKHYLSGKDPLPEFEENDDGSILIVKNIKWGRKVY